MSLALADLEACFEGLIPASLCTVDPDGVPNLMHLSRVVLVDDKHVALSRQFFGKTARNLEANPRASILVTRPADYDHFRLDVLYLRSETEGALFDQLKAYVDVVASLTGMTDVFRLRSADVFEVLTVEHVESGEVVAL